jgi:hypothetical protein
MAVGTVTRIGVVRQEPPMRRRTTLTAWSCAALAAVELVLTPFAGGVSMLAKALLVIAVCGSAVYALRRWLPHPSAIDVHPFWIKDVTGSEHSCLVCGDLREGALAQGAEVEVYGWVDSSGSVVVRQLITAGGEVCKPRLPLPHRMSRGAAFLIIALWATAALTIAWLLLFSG